MSTVPRRRWLRFSLRTMFVLMTLVVLWLGWQVHIVRTRRAAVLELRNNPAAQIFTAAEFENPLGSPKEAAVVSKLRLLLGDEPVSLIRYDSGWRAANLVRMKELFPEADVGYRSPGIQFDSPDQSSPKR
jgi:hypothetical protein